VTKKETLRLANDDQGKVLLYNIACSESDIRMCMHINKVFQIQMSLSEDLIVKISNESVGFRKYQYIDETEDEKYTLIINQHAGKYLFPEYKKIDFILIINSEMNSQSYEDKIKRLKEQEGISAIFKTDPASVKSFKRILL
jgi:hypothetical protein